MDSARATTIGLVIPVLNAARHLDALLPALRQQHRLPDRFLVVDSQSDDDSAERLRAAGAEVITIARAEFDHGRTRQRAAELLNDCDILIYLTQDAIPADADSFTNLVAAFDDPAVGVAYGRQLPRSDATPISTHARLFNYPPTSASVTFDQRTSLGIKTCFSSNSFAAYRRIALQAVGGFPDGKPVGEDVVVAAKMLREGWIKRYVAEARVFHSHNYSIVLDGRRAFDVGASYASAPELFEAFGGATGEGRRFVISELRYLARHAPWSIASALARTIAKAVGYNLGRRNRMLPRWLRRHFGLHRDYWERLDARDQRGDRAARKRVAC